MTATERRLRALEAAAKRKSPLSDLADEELDRRIDVLLAKCGTSRENIVTQPGGWGAFYHALLLSVDGTDEAPANDGRTARERYMAMLG